MLFISCNSNSQISHFELIAESPTGCKHVFYLDNNGKGRYIAGMDEANGKASEIEDIIKQGVFTLNSDKWQIFLNEISELKSDFVKTERPKDAMKYMLMVDGKQRILSYARKSEVINVLRDLISSSMSNPIDFSCESYID